jgi:hypothetical protein
MVSLNPVQYGRDWPRIDGRPVMPNVDLNDEETKHLAAQQRSWENRIKDRQERAIVNFNMGM